MNGRWRLPVWKLMVAVGVLALLLSCCIVPLGRHTEFHRLSRQIDSSLRNLRPTDPASVDIAAWDCVHSRVFNAFCNVCFSPYSVHPDEMYRLRDNIDTKLKGKVDMDTLVWIWDRLGETGPEGKRYTERFRPLLGDCLPALKPRSGR